MVKDDIFRQFCDRFSWSSEANEDEPSPGAVSGITLTLNPEWRCTWRLVRPSDSGHVRTTGVNGPLRRAKQLAGIQGDISNTFIITH